MKIRQEIRTFAFTGEIVNTTVAEWIDEQRQGDFRNATPEDLEQLGEAVAAGYLAQIAALTADLTTAAAVITGTSEQLAALTLERDSAAAENEALKAQITALTSPPSPATLAFRTLPIEIQEQFQSSYDTAVLLIDAGRHDLAIAHIEGLKIPKNLEPYRAGILDLLKS